MIMGARVDAGIVVSNPVPFVDSPTPANTNPDRDIIVEGGKFVIERLASLHERRLSLSTPAWIIPVIGSGTVDGHRFTAGECWMIAGDATINIDAASDVLLAYPGAVRADF
jgi:mannose-6-phosphate isomerase